MNQNREELVDLDKIYIKTLNECGKGASKELIKQEFLFVLNDIGEKFLRKRLKYMKKLLIG